MGDIVFSLGNHGIVSAEAVHESVEEVDHCVFSLVNTDIVGVDVVGVVTDDMVIELTVLQLVVAVKGDICLHMGLAPLSGDGKVLPLLVCDAWLLRSEVVVMRLVFKFHSVVSNTPVEGVFDISGVVSDAAEEGPVSVWLDPAGQRKAVVEG